MNRLLRFGLVIKNLVTLSTPNNLNRINKVSRFSTTTIYRQPTPPSSFTAKGSIPAWDEHDHPTVERPKDGISLENWHKGIYSRYIDSKLGDGGPAEHLKHLQKMHKRLLLICETLDQEIAACKKEGDKDHEAIVQNYNKYAKWSEEVISDRLAEVKKYVDGLKGR
ncbi:uncharacterized protein GGS22DRAFT_194050 [Annulohypoxylon maeteangense]|uniref:uncharacterized protein n=1 Tax=Annulohypoxylon maeteangense TaxID=1927788 RepID=UPI002007DBC5|nr:uncharacterized protein GGS22DRAFT_194050 [Annulohypoxylon maeteangense]KAI0889655.1 hypothetical protein GGS22DRAFT_194050 [Annulohypoxylon maeteangense]